MTETIDGTPLQAQKPMAAAASDTERSRRPPFVWFRDFEEHLKQAGIEDPLLEREALAPARLIRVGAEDWGACAQAACRHDLRWVAGWGEDEGGWLAVNACFEMRGDYLIFRARLPRSAPRLPSQAPVCPAADRSERHTQDLLGIRFEGHPDGRRWTRHQAWPKDAFPLRKDFPSAGYPEEITPADVHYPFLQAKGSSVYEIPVGPVHAGIIEPGHFRFQAVGETVLNLEERLGYVHKGIEKIAEGRTPEQLVRLAGRVSGDTTVGHAWAACMAMERAARVEVPPRAAFLRAVLAERERIANHLGDMGAICNDVGFTFAHIQFGRLRELWLRDNMQVFGHRLLMDHVLPGGVKHDLRREGIDRMHAAIAFLRKEMGDVLRGLDVNSSLEDRLLTTGRLSPEAAKALGTLGYVGRSSGQHFDVRRDAPYAPYDLLSVGVPVEEQGDVAARFWVRYKEIRSACRLLEVMLRMLPGGAVLSEWITPPAGAEGLGVVEGWRGEILCHIRFDADNRIARYYPRDPSAMNWPALQCLILDNIVPDFPVCNKSVNGSYSGQDL